MGFGARRRQPTAGTAALARVVHPGMTGRARWYWLLVIPFLGLAFPALYAQAAPSLFGFPFFYWYQFAWLLVSSAVTAIVYERTR